MNQTPETNRGTSGWRRLALPASIILNLFLIALIGGHVLHARREGVPGTPLARALARAEELLPPQDAAAFRGVIQRDSAHYAEDWRQFLAARDQLERRIAAEPFDREAVRQGFDTWQAAWRRFFDDFSNTLVEALAQVSPEGRRKLVAGRGRQIMGPANPAVP
jgi:uncharacterized membrane protein